MNVYKNITLSAKTDLFLAYIPDCQAFTVGPTPATNSYSPVVQNEVDFKTRAGAPIANVKLRIAVCLIRFEFNQNVDFGRRVN